MSASSRSWPGDAPAGYSTFRFGFGTPSKEEKHLSDKVLVVVSQRGFWAEELFKPLEQLEEGGYEVEFATPSKANGTPYPESGELRSCLQRSSTWTPGDV
jgi:putative intracellular protease/amidase